MRVIIPLVVGLLGVTTALSLDPRDPQRDVASFGDEDRGRDRGGDDRWDDSERDWDSDDRDDDRHRHDDKKDKKMNWKAKTKNPHFFNLVVDWSSCDNYEPECHYWWCNKKRSARSLPKRQEPTPSAAAPAPESSVPGAAAASASSVAVAAAPLTPAVAAGAGQIFGTGNECKWKLKNYVIILNYGKVLAVPYKSWFKGRLATFFVDDDTRLYTVSKQPLSLYVDRVDAQLRYTNVGWLSPNALATGFFHQGTNPERSIPSSAYLSWPITYGLSFPEWIFCEIGSTKHYEIFANIQNWQNNQPQGLLDEDAFKDCFAAPLAALNTNPWKGKKGNDKKDNDYDNDHDYE